MKSFFLGVALVAISLGAQEVGGVGSGGGATAVPIPSETPVTGDPLHPSIAVLPLRGQAASTYGDPSDDIYQRVTGAFFKTRRFTVIERNQLGAVLNEGKNQGTVAFDEASAITLGRQVGAKIVVIGSYTANMSRTTGSYQTKNGGTEYYELFPGTVVVNLRLVNVESGKIQDVIDATGTGKESTSSKSVAVTLDDLSKKLDREVSNHFPLTGYVIKVIDEKQAMIDLGQNQGVNSSDEFIVFERGEDIVHPVTGKVIKGEKKVITEFKVQSVQEDSATVKITGAKVAIKPGMALESKPKKRGFWEAVNDTLLK